MELTQYLNTIPDHRKSRFDAILKQVHALYPSSHLSMKYKMPTFEYEQGWISIGNQMNYISVYTFSEAHIADFKLKNPNIKTGKGCINFKDSDDINTESLQAVIRRALEFKKS